MSYGLTRRLVRTQVEVVLDIGFAYVTVRAFSENTSNLHPARTPGPSADYIQFAGAANYLSVLCVGIVVISADILLLITLSCQSPRYVDSMRTHGHRAARMCPLDPARYGLTDENKRCNVGGIVDEIG
jgi:hypothetical protein